MCDSKKVCAWRKECEHWILHTDVDEVTKAHFKKDSTVLRERLYVLHDDAHGHSAMTVKYFLANHGIVEMSHPHYSPDLLPADCFLFPERKKTWGHWGQQGEHNCQIKCSSFGCLWLLFCANSIKMWKVCCSQADYTGEKIKQSSAYFICYVFTERFLEIGCFSS